MKDKIRWYKYQIYVLLILSPSFLFTSPNKFAKTFGGSVLEVGLSVQQTNDGGYILAGYTNSFGAGLQDFLVLKLNSQGNLEWTKTFGGSYGDEGQGVQQTNDGGYIVAGNTGSFGMGMFDVLVLKLNSQGNLDWAKTFGGSYYDEVYSIQQTNDGGYILAGNTSSFGAGSRDVLVLKLLNSQGNVDWAKTIGWSGWDVARSIRQTSDGGYIVAGWTNSFGAGGYDVLVLKLSSQGNLDWAKTFGGSSSELGYSVQQTNDGGYILAGYTNSFGVGDYDFLVFKLNSQGNLDWAKTFGGSGTDLGFSVQQTNDGGYILAGYTNSFGAGVYNVLVLKLSSQGNLDWAKTFGGSSSELGYSVQQTNDGGYIVVGRSSSFIPSAACLVLKLDADGSYPDCVDDCTPTVTSPTVSVISITPTITSPSLTITSPTVFSLSPTLSISDACAPLGEYELPLPSSKDREISSSYLLWFDAYYSPYSNSIIIKYRMNKESMVNLALYDLSGNLLKSIYSGFQEKGYHKFDVKIKENPGIYFIKLNINKSIFTRKITILK